MIKDFKTNILKKMKGVAEIADSKLTKALSDGKDSRYTKALVHYLKKYDEYKVVSIIRYNDEGIVDNVELSKNTFRYKEEMIKEVNNLLFVEDIEFLNLVSSEESYLTNTGVGVKGNLDMRSDIDKVCDKVLSILDVYELTNEVEFVTSRVSLLSYNPYREDLDPEILGHYNKARIQDRIDRKLYFVYLGFNPNSSKVRFSKEFNDYYSVNNKFMEDLKALCSIEDLKLISAGELGLIIGVN